MKYIYSILSKFIIVMVSIVIVGFSIGYIMSLLNISKSLNLIFVEINTINQIGFKFIPIYIILISVLTTMFLELIQYLIKRKK